MQRELRPTTTGMAFRVCGEAPLWDLLVVRYLSGFPFPSPCFDVRAVEISLSSKEFNREIINHC